MSASAAADAGRAIRVLFVIRSLERGGAEGQLVSLAKGMAERGFTVAVLTLYPGGSLAPRIVEGGAAHISLDKRSRWDLIMPLWRAVRHVRRFRPDIVHGYLPVGNIFALLLGRSIGAKVIWGIRASRMDTAMYDWLNAASLRVATWCSRWVDLIICNSQSGAADHISDGFPAARSLVIPNGIDTQRFRPNSVTRAKTRGQWGIGEAAFVLGHVGRVDPVKDHSLLFRATAELFARQPHVRRQLRITCVASGDPTSVAPLASLIASLGLSEHVRWLWNLEAPEDVYVAFDALAMTSNAEGFPNVVGEAMSCAVPCVATDVGDTALLLGECGYLVPPRDVSAFAHALRRSIEATLEQRNELGARARERVLEHFDRRRLINRTEEALRALVRGYQHQRSAAAVVPSMDEAPDARQR